MSSSRCSGDRSACCGVFIGGIGGASIGAFVGVVVCSLKYVLVYSLADCRCVRWLVAGTFVGFVTGALVG